MAIKISDLYDLLTKRDIPMDAKITSDSGWERCATDVESVFYDPSKNEVILCSRYVPMDRRVGQIMLLKPENGFEDTNYIVDPVTNIVSKKSDNFLKESYI